MLNYFERKKLMSATRAQEALRRAMVKAGVDQKVVSEVTLAVVDTSKGDPYADYIGWQVGGLEGENLARAIAYIRAYLNNARAWAQARGGFGGASVVGEVVSHDTVEVMRFPMAN